MSDGKVALITGVAGRDGAYLPELLLSKGYVREMVQADLEVMRDAPIAKGA